MQNKQTGEEYLHNNYESLDNHQKTAVDALVELKRICDKHGIRFYLLAGSCLGAVRHGGMIPWDDDIDVGLLRDDWLRLREVISEELDIKFTYIDENIQDNWPFLFGKILFEDKLCIDLFLLVRWTGSTIRGEAHWFITKIAQAGYMMTINNVFRAARRPEWSNLRFLRNRVVYFLKKAAKPLVCAFFDREDFIRLARWNDSFFEGKKTDWYINLYSVYSMKKEMLRAKWLDCPSQVRYEGNIYDTVGDTDAYLSHLYGDYMTLPPEERRVRMHEDNVT